jgi:hypothetical protein
MAQVAICRCGRLYGPGLWLPEGSLCGVCERERVETAVSDEILAAVRS